MFELRKSSTNRFSETSCYVHMLRLIVLLCTFLAVAERTPFLISSHSQEPAVSKPDNTALLKLNDNSIADLELHSSSQVFQIDLLADDYVDLLITKGDLHLSATLFTPAGDVLFKSLSMRYEPLHVTFITPKAGEYRLEIRSLEKKDPAGVYNVKFATRRAATPEDHKITAALALLMDAAELRRDGREPALREAISTYIEAAKQLQAVGRQTDSATALESIGDIYFALSENQEALNYYRQALNAGRPLHDLSRDLRALNKIGYVYVYLGQAKKALTYATRVLTHNAVLQSPDIEAQRLEAETLNTAGEAHYSLGSLRKSIGFFNDALALWKSTHDRNGEALAHLNLGYSYSDLGDLQQGREQFTEALSLWQEVDERRGQAQTLTAIGALYTFLGDKQKALDSHAEAMSIFRTIGDQEGQAVALNSVAKAYEDLNQPQTALDNYNRALQIYRERGHHDFEAVTKYYLGRIYETLGDKKRAVDFYQQSMMQSRNTGQQRVMSYALSAVSALRSSEGNKTAALGQLKQVLRLYRRLEDRRGQAKTLNDIGHIYAALGKTHAAVRCYKQALPLSRAANDRMSEADTLYHLARVERDSGSLNDALTSIQDSLKTIESLRAQIISPELRVSYFASVHKHSELYIDLLMKLDKLKPEKGFRALALQASENARARALLEILGQPSAQIRQGVDEKLLERERALQLQLSAKAAYQMRVAGKQTDAEEVDKTNQELRNLNIAYQEIQTQIKQESPAYANLVQPQPLQAGNIQAELGDADTLLLEYALGEERSYFWAVTSTSITGFELPARAEIEQAARDVYKALTIRQSIGASANYQESIASADREYWKQAARVSQMLLGPIAAQLGKKRLLVVAEGALQYLPFEALPVPDSGSDQNYTPLVLDHEIINLPSVSTLAAIRRERSTNRSADKLVAILADPVFERDDPRLRTLVNSVAADPPSGVMKIDKLGERTNIARLPATRQEGEAIMAVAPAGQGSLATDFDACRAKATCKQVGRHRIVHFATHGIINTEHPELSGIMLSLLDREGRTEDGFLQLHDVYNLDLSGTQLVVLSACQTGLGKDVKGEGLVGLTRGFMYAGAHSVVASLWKVDDRATAELMKYFYKAMLDEGMTPAAALRKAKQSMWEEERWHAPYFWAAFVLQGEYRDPIVMPPVNVAANYFQFSTTFFTIVVVILHALKRRRRTSKTVADLT